MNARVIGLVLFLTLAMILSTAALHHDSRAMPQPLTHPSRIGINGQNIDVQYSLTILGTPGSINGAKSINKSGQVAGYSDEATGDPHAYLWLPGPAYGMPA